MSQDGNAYQGLTPERKLHQFLFEAERFMTSIIYYSKLLSAEAQKPPLQTLLSSDFAQSLDTIQKTGAKFARSLREITTPENADSQPDPLVQTLIILLNLSYSPISVIMGYSKLLETEAHKLPDLSPKFMDDLKMMQTAADRLSKTHEELANSMK